MRIVSGSNQHIDNGVQKFCGTWINTGEVTDDPQLAALGAPQTPPAPSCPTGKCLGEYNSKKMCLPCGSGTEPNTSVNTTTNQDGSTTTTTTTNDGTATTTDTLDANADGQVTAEETADNYDDDTAATHSANCSTAPTCSGDAVQCAQLRQQWATMCASQVEQFEANDPLVTEGIASYNNANTGVDNDTFSLPSTLDQTGFLTGSCLPDKPVNMGSLGTFNIPYSQFCWFFEALGMIIIGIASIASAKIVGVF